MTDEQEQVKTIRTLAGKLRDAKDAEALAREVRIGIETQIAELVPTDEEGQKTIPVGDGVKLTVKRSLAYRADMEEIARTLNRLGLRDGNKYHPPIKTTTRQELDVAGYKWYRKESPEVWKAIAEHVVVTPRKVAVTLKEK